MSLHLLQPLIDVPESGGKGPPIGRWASGPIGEVRNHPTFSRISRKSRGVPALSFPPIRYPVIMVTIQGEEGRRLLPFAFSLLRKTGQISHSLSSAKKFHFKNEKEQFKCN
ncbi:hypothetical protein TNCV_3522241 [Trichonephila clavipes]|uniref:Uncharacterized protein n=1 Tax=Trichonephila clavipes TaxID=2585209 RepID=A0A8X6WA93_TRICX|nr:hypothetical protein TNCV_3522241 [Trichonephila clavipes]